MTGDHVAGHKCNLLLAADLIPMICLFCNIVNITMPFQLDSIPVMSHTHLNNAITLYSLGPL